MRMADELFQGIENVQLDLVKEIRCKMGDARVGTEQLDEICMLGRGDPDFPSCSEFLGSHERLTAKAFSLVASALRISLAHALNFSFPSLADDKKHAVYEDMRANGFSVVAASTGDVQSLTDEQKAPAYVLFKLLHELNEATTSARA